MKVSLVLGSGGARGYAHIGAIEELASRGHEIVAVAGSSIGALMGGAYAAGKLDDLTKVAKRLTRTDVLMLARPSLTAPGLIKLDRVMHLLGRIIGDVRIEELPMPFTAVATDLFARREIWFHDGPLLAAIRASISIPTIFEPVMLDHRLLVDGGLVNPLPMETSLRWDTDVTVAVSLLGRSHEREFGGAVEMSSDQMKESGRAGLGRLPERLAEVLPSRARSRTADGLFEPLPDDLGIASMTTMTLDVMQERIQASRLAVNPPDVHVEIPASAATTFDFNDAHRLIELGRKLAAERFDEVGL
ncbi:patatin-like phospholipase family protein [Propionimicrobium sp. PCR01-08-3]|uniref:patatin-like phospholipase family protein n=1 Tax=Propionimicrobium sp. PCR01-08-3 TaxID=3052086 RepID=UPI00255CC145|nr:patatin-like phospholipase family protein [Propionimicrobium sp. PCR01-08-3]WIY81872.1 patatin-like phospholipase family protein [Propionimicrobium sp. PCR01-08-3]